MCAIVMEDRAGSLFFIFPKGEIELSHMGKNSGKFLSGVQENRFRFHPIFAVCTLVSFIFQKTSHYGG